MTVIAAIWDEARGETWIGSDSQANADGRIVAGVKKWIVREPWAVGVAGSLRTTNLVEANGDDLLRDLRGAYDFTRRLAAEFADGQFNSDTERGPKDWGQQLILAHPGGVWSICCTLSILPIRSNILWADGSGGDFALGAGHVAKGRPGVRLQAAIDAAIHWSSSCGGEVFLQRLKA